MNETFSALRACDVIGPWTGFALAAHAAVADLHRRFGLELWLVTHVDDDKQEVVAAAGPWEALASPGLVFAWAESFCRRMVATGGPSVEPDVHASTTYAEVAVGAAAQVHAYLGVPLLSTEGRLFGSLCGYAAAPQPPSLASVLEPVLLVGRMLSTILAGEQNAADRSQDAAQAYALVERDPLTGLRNRRGWLNALTSEEQRARRYGSPLSVLTVDLDGLARLNEHEGWKAGDAALVACAAALGRVCRAGDVLARTGGDEVAVLAVECDAVSARALAMKLRVQLRTAGVAASLGYATRRSGETIDNTDRRAKNAMRRDKDRRARRVSSAGVAAGTS